MPGQTKTMQNKYYNSADLVDRLCYAANRKDRPVTFLVGSPLSCPDYPGTHGVPGVNGMIDLIRDEFADTDAHSEIDQHLSNNPAHRYQMAFEFLHGRRGQDVVNRIVRTAVWRALDAKTWPTILPDTTPNDADAATCNTLDKHPDAWVLPTAADLFGRLLVACADTFGHSVLTTNFDPLIEIAVAKHHGQCYRTVLQGDGSLGQTVAEGTHVVHLHGYWWGADTLHTPQQLLQPRPQLRHSLAQVISSGLLVVLGYGGWDDVITTTLLDLLQNSTSNPEILWAFHSDYGDHIEATNQPLLAALRPGIGRGRVQLYRGIDCSSLFTDLHHDLKSSYPLATTPPRGANIQTVITERPVGSVGSRRVHVQIDFPMAPVPSPESDRPLLVTPWVGRNQELALLAASATPVAFLTGLGGQGKSALAGRFLQEYAMSTASRFEIWDWRDCREEATALEPSSCASLSA